MKFQSANEKTLPILTCGILLKWHVLYGAVFSRMMLFILLAFHLQFDSLEACWFFFPVVCARSRFDSLEESCFSCWRKRGKKVGI